MANWVQNWVTFQGEEFKIKKVYSEFEKMQNKENETNRGQLPEFFNDVPKQDWFFDIHIDDMQKDFVTIQYATKWSPNVQDLIEIANHFCLNFSTDYEESGNDIFGKAIFTFGNSEAEFLDLDQSDYDKFEYLEDEDVYLYKGVKWDSEAEILDDIFEEKFNQPY